MQKQDAQLIKLSIPGLVVDKMLQFWLHRARFKDKLWLTENLEMVWSMVTNDVQPKWDAPSESDQVKAEIWHGLMTAVRMIDELVPENFHLHIQPTFFENITDKYSITGSADLLMTEKTTGESILIDFKNAHRRTRITKDQLLIYQIGLKCKMPLNIVRAGYLFYNPRLEQWKWFKLGPTYEEKMLAKLAQATEEVRQGKFDFIWNNFTCPRFCDVRFSCELFQSISGKHPKGIEDSDCKRIVVRRKI